MKITHFKFKISYPRIQQVGSVCAILTNERFPAHGYNKLATRKIGPLEVSQKINPNAYRLKLPSDVHTYDVFNVKHLVPYFGEQIEHTAEDLKSNLSYPGGNDAA